MTRKLFVRTFRVVAYRADGTRGFLQENLPRNIAEDIRATMSTVYPKVLIEEEPPAPDPDEPPAPHAP